MREEVLQSKEFCSLKVLQSKELSGFHLKASIPLRKCLNKYSSYNSPTHLQQNKKSLQEHRAATKVRHHCNIEPAPDSFLHKGQEKNECKHNERSIVYVPAP